MSNDKNRVASKLARMQKETGEAGAAVPSRNDDLVEQLAHEEAGQPDFAELANKLKERKDAEKEPSFLESTVKFTIYVDSDVAEAFKALCIERGDQRRYATQAFSDFVLKKTKELGL